MTQRSYFWQGAVTGHASLAPYDDDELALFFRSVLAYDNTEQGVVRVNSDYDLKVVSGFMGFGYFGGGWEPSWSSAVEKMTFSTEVCSVHAYSLSVARASLSAVSDVSDYGYFAGGYTGGSAFVTADRIVFATGVTSANAVSNLSLARLSPGGVSDGATYGYFAGGYASGCSGVADRIVFATGVTSANAVSNLSTGRSGVTGVSDGGTYGYFAGGFCNPNWMSTTDRIVFATGVTSANAVSNLSNTTADTAGVSDTATYGYVVGGDNNYWSKYVTANRIVFSTGVTSANTVSNLSLGRSDFCGIGNAVSYGYFSGGTIDNSFNSTALTDRIVFSGGITLAQTTSNLTVVQARHAGLSSTSV